MYWPGSGAATGAAGPSLPPQAASTTSAAMPRPVGRGRRGKTGAVMGEKAFEKTREKPEKAGRKQRIAPDARVWKLLVSQFSLWQSSPGYTQRRLLVNQIVNHSGMTRNTHPPPKHP